jgi:hypothetical protein
MGTASATFELFDVGLYVDALAIGAAPSWELPAWDADLRACQRYYEIFSTTEMLWSIDATNLQSYSFGVPYRVTKRTGTPSVALTNNMTGFNAPALSLANATGFRVSAVCNVTSTARAFSFGATVTDRF